MIPGRIRQLERRGSLVEARVGCGAEFHVHMDSRSAESCGLDVASEVWLMINHPLSHDPGDLQRAEIAGRFGVPVDSLDRLGIKAVSAGLTARPGEPIAVEVEQALGKIGLPVHQHRSRNLTCRLAERAEAIFCMTEEQRRELTSLFPAAQPKSYRLHPEMDLCDPHGNALDGFLDCALQIQDLVRHRLNGLGVCRPAQGRSPSWA